MVSCDVHIKHCVIDGGARRHIHYHENYVLVKNSSVIIFLYACVLRYETLKVILGFCMGSVWRVRMKDWANENKGKKSDRYG